MQEWKLLEAYKEGKMPIVIGKPGSIKYRGVIRAQMRVGLAKVTELLRYNTKQAARQPPVEFLNQQREANLQACKVSLQALLDSKN